MAAIARGVHVVVVICRQLKALVLRLVLLNAYVINLLTWVVARVSVEVGLLLEKRSLRLEVRLARLVEHGWQLVATVLQVAEAMLLLEVCFTQVARTHHSEAVHGLPLRRHQKHVFRRFHLQAEGLDLAPLVPEVLLPH